MSSIRHLRPLALATVLVAAAAGAHAEGFYAGGALSAPDYDSAINGYGDGASGRGPGFKLYGGYQFTPNFSLEGGAFNLGTTRSTNGGDARAYGAFVDAVGSYEFVPHWSVLGSAGVAQAHFTSASGSDNSPGLKLGVGLQYDLTANTSLRLGYDRYHFIDAYDAKPNVGSTSLGVKVNF